MKKFRELISRPFVTVALFALALVLLGGSTVGGARAALTVESDLYNSQVETYNIDVALLENGDEVEDELFTKLLGEGESLKIGKKYNEELRVLNTGRIDEYVRVSVYRYWLQKDPETGKMVKTPAMDSKWIKLDFATGNGWSIDDASSTEERTVLYYADPLTANVPLSEPFLTSFTIDESAARLVTWEDKQADGVIVRTTNYVYNGSEFCVEVHVDGVQTHNADKAKLSAWGVNDK